MKSAHPLRGFTLLEVLVALAILAIAMSAVVKATAGSATAVGYLRDQTLASWVALNRINEALLARDVVDPGSSRGTAAMAGRDWQWELQVSGTTDPDLRRLDVTVHAQGDNTTLAQLTAFKKRPRR